MVNGKIEPLAGLSIEFENGEFIEKLTRCITVIALCAG